MKPKLEDCSPSLLRTLLAFAETGSVSKAAEALGEQQPVISRRLKVFQASLGSGGPLIEKQSRRRLRLSQRGQAVLPVIRAVVTK